MTVSITKNTLNRRKNKRKVYDKKKAVVLLSSTLFLQSFCQTALAETLQTPNESLVSVAPAGGSPTAQQAPAQTPTILPTALTNTLNSEPSFIDIAMHNGTLSFAGDFINSGNLTLFTSNSAFNSVTISATNIINTQGATISTILPTGGYTGALNVPLNLVLNATNGIFNAGTISSSGSLAMHAEVIANVMTSPNIAPPVMQAMDSVSMVASTILNQGAISSALSNINISGLSNSLAINSLNNSLAAYPSELRRAG